MTSKTAIRDFRSLCHYAVGTVTMVLYGGQVCPLVETLKIHHWAVQLGIIFGLVFLFRSFHLDRILDRYDLGRHSLVQFWTELGWFILAGLVIACINQVVYGFSGIDSGLKMILGATALGFFMAADMAMLRERAVDRALAQKGKTLHVTAVHLPMTVKFAFTATVSAVFVTAVILLVILKDLESLMGLGSLQAVFARQSVIKEISLVAAVFLLHTINLILSYSKNLNLAVGKENEALIRASRGKLDTRVTVSSHDEFGVMAQYTNQMIQTLEKNNRAIRQARDATIIALASLAETRDNETGGHIYRTQAYVKALAMALQNHPDFRTELDDETIRMFFKSAPLHDIGKVGIPDRILLKSGKLTTEEFEIMKQHTVLGKEALEKAAKQMHLNDFLTVAQDIICFHHERWDGSGYPSGLRGRQIPVSARLMALADVYDALISKRVYKPAFSHEKARGIIMEGRASHFDPDVVDAFVAVEDQFQAIAARYSGAHS